MSGLAITIDQSSPLDKPGNYRSILVGADSSDHSNHAVVEAVALATQHGAKFSASHVYAAKMHDTRFRQMEGGLPEQFRAEKELERQRDVHDDLITRGLSIITDSYLDQAEHQCDLHSLTLHRRPLEGKNYRALLNEANNGQYDLLVMGARGLGAVEGSRLGTVCDRVVRRANLDTLVIHDPNRSLRKGSIMVAIDGSPQAYGGLCTALLLAKDWQVPLIVVAAFDPYYHYIAFNRIAGVLSEEAGKVFRFQEQEKLHEEIIDSGLAKIYQGHLEVAETIAKEYGVAIETKLLDGKPHDAIEKQAIKTDPSLLVIGRIGIHADAELDIGGNAENLLRNVNCAVLLSERCYQPQVEVIAEVTTSWTDEAEQHMQKVPTFVQGMARMAVLRYAQKHGHTVVTASIVEEATRELCPSHAREAMSEIVQAYDQGELSTKSSPTAEMSWSTPALAALNNVNDIAVRDNTRRRAEKKARVSGANQVEHQHVVGFLDQSNNQTALHWQADALASLACIDDQVLREHSRGDIEGLARQQGETTVSLSRVEDFLLQHPSVETANAAYNKDSHSASKCPFGFSSDTSKNNQASFEWTTAAKQRLEKVPQGFMRQLTKQRVETFAQVIGETVITESLMRDKYAQWAQGSSKQTQTMDWNDAAMDRINRIPEFIRGMVIKEMERCARQSGAQTVTLDVLSKARDAWSTKGLFHSEANPEIYSD